MSSYIINGGKPLHGEITASGNKNAALPCLAAALLTDGEVVLNNVPDIEDVQVMMALVREAGADVSPLKSGTVKIKTQNLISHMPAELAGAIRASILCAGPMLARTGEVVLPPPGGDVIGLRRLDTHFLAFSALGANPLVLDDRNIRVSSPGGRLQGGELFLDEMSVTATENAVMASATAAGRTVITNAASEPHVQDLCRMLVQMGASISGIGSNRLIIDGTPYLTGTEFTIGSDLMEIGSYIGLTAAVGGDIIVHGADRHQLPMIRNGFGKIGMRWKDELPLHISATDRLIIQPDISGMIPKIDDAPWPGFPPDLLSIITVAATQAEGTVLIHEKMFESRMYFIDMLIRMGARVIQCDPHRAVVSGPARLQGSLVTSPDIRAGMALVIAALSADGKSVIQNVYQIERGYEQLCLKLQQLGADIIRQESEPVIQQ